MKTPHFRSLRAIALTAVGGAMLIAGCAGGQGPGWTFAPLGPTQAPAESPAGSPGESPAGSPGMALQVTTPAAQPLVFEPNELSAPAATEVTVEYVNESNLPHNVHFFAGEDASAPSLAATETVTGPGATTSATFTTPDEPGGYFFHCDVHPQMVGTLSVGE